MIQMAKEDPKGGEMVAAEVLGSIPGSPAKGTKRLTRARGGAPLPVNVAGPGPVKKSKSGPK